MVIVLFGHRLGTKMPDGSAYPSGTAYELLRAIRAAEANDGQPAVYVFRTSAERSFLQSQKAEFEAAEAERARLDAFIERWFRGPDGETLRHMQRFSDPDDLAGQADELLRRWAGLSLRTAPEWHMPAMARRSVA